MQKHVWLTAEFSVRAETLCMTEETRVAPGGDYRTAPRHPTGRVCIKGAHHNGKHTYTPNPDIRLYAFNEPKL